MRSHHRLGQRDTRIGAGDAMRLGVLLTTAMLLVACSREKRAVEAPAAPPLQFERVAVDPVRHGERMARYDDFGLDRAIRSGRRSDGSEMWEMPSHLFSQLSQADMAALIAYLRSRPATGEDHPRPPFGPLARREIAAGTWTSAAAQVSAEGRRWPPRAAGGHALARYMIRRPAANATASTSPAGSPIRRRHRAPTSPWLSSPMSGRTSAACCAPQSPSASGIWT